MNQWIATTRHPIGAGALFLITDYEDGMAPEVAVADGTSRWSAPLEIERANA